MQQTDGADAFNERAQITEILAVPEADLDLIKIHKEGQCGESPARVTSSCDFLSKACTDPTWRWLTTPLPLPLQYPCPRGQAPFVTVLFVSTSTFRSPFSPMQISIAIRVGSERTLGSSACSEPMTRRRAPGQKG